MPKNPNNRYLVVRPGNSVERGMWLADCRYIEEARKIRDDDWNNETFIWDRNATQYGQNGGAVA